MTITTILVKALTNTVLGMGTVFLVLIFIACLIALLPCITAVLESVGKKKGTKRSVLQVQAGNPESAVSKSDAESEKESDDDTELAAVIAAAIAAAEGIPAEGFIVRSIRRMPGSQWKKR